MKTLEELIKEENIQTIEELFTKHPDRWCKGSLFLDEEGNVINEIEQVLNDDVEPTHCCLVGAAEFMGKYQALRIARLKESPFVFIGDWNDRPERTVQDIIAFCKKYEL